MKPEDRKRLKQHIEMIVEHKEPTQSQTEKILRDAVEEQIKGKIELEDKNRKLRLDLHTLRFKEAQENRFVWWVYQVYARNVLDLVQSVPVMCPCDTDEDVPFIELAARIKEYTEHIYDGTYLDTAMSTEQSNSDVSMTQDVSIDIKTPQSIENTNPDYYKDELYLDEDFRMLAKTYPADVSAIGVTTLIDYVEAVEAELARLTAELAMQKSLVAAREQDLNELHIALSQLREYTLKNENIIRDLRERTRWIPVSERLPEYGKAVLIMTTTSVLPRIGRHSPTIPQWATTDLLYYHDISYSEVTHWMPLPEPPESEG